MPRGVPNKRAAADEAAPSPKKQKAPKRADEGAPEPKKPRAPKKQDESKAIIDALGDAELPAEVLGLLKAAAPVCLTTFADARHAYQVEVIDMLSEALAAVETNLNKKVTEAEATLGGLNRDKREKDVLEAARAVAEAKTAAAHKEADLVGAKLKLTKAQEHLKPVVKAQATGDADYAKLEVQKGKLDAVIKQVEEAGAAALAPKTLAALSKDFQALELDGSLVASLAAVLAKEPTARGEFDQTTLSSCKTELGAKSGFVTAKLKELQPGKDERQAAVSGAQAAQASCKAAFDAAKAGVSEADKAVKAAVEALGTTQELWHDFAKTKKAAEDSVQEAKGDIADFKEGALASFENLKSRTTPVAPPAEPEASPVKAAPAAAAA